MHLSTLSEWLHWIGSVHRTDIDLGLDRVKAVAAKCDLLSLKPAVIIVGGTNGKGSTVATLAAIYRAQGLQVGTFSSPVLFHHNEQVCINGEPVQDKAFCEAFEKIESVRGTITLTPFEYHTLAALFIFKQYALQVLILEVGLGGRLDAVNVVDADLSVITSIGIDHTEWLGKTRESIALEKAGILRPHHPAVCGDLNPPSTLIDYAKQLNAPLYCQGRDFQYREHTLDWDWQTEDVIFSHLPYCQLALQNVSTALMCITLLQAQLPVSQRAIQKGIQKVQLPGRIQVIPGEVIEIYDVSHNPDSVALFASYLSKNKISGKTFAVFSMLGDKDREASIKAIQPLIDEWYIAPINHTRATDINTLLNTFDILNISERQAYPDLKQAYQAVRGLAVKGDRILVFGSFHTVAEVWPIRRL